MRSRKGIALAYWRWQTDMIHFLADVPTDEIDGIPVSELLDHLFTAKSFKRDEIEEKFKLPRYRHTELAKKLKEIGVLVQGPCNAHVLNGEFSRQDIALMLRGKTSTEDLEPLFRKRGTSYTAEPSAGEIEKRVSALLSPASGFLRREISESAEPSRATDAKPMCDLLCN